MSNSLFQRAYYTLKPFFPKRLRYAIRGASARSKLRGVSNIWPIMPGSERPPKQWPGWVNGKRFAFVLTHDVEGKRGLEHCRQLAELEIRLGFRSSFNFIPEGEYSVPGDLRSWLSANGFEVGVHDHRHDGKLYQSRQAFGQSAKVINAYLKGWGAVGFRSGFMFHNLHWLQELDVNYDASTFDTDPFEPQPSGVKTIFPFWVPSSAQGRGYAELPYTLAQDSTLFLLLQQRTTEIWKKKLDWIAHHGGMALVNIHPDYVGFGDTKTKTPTYPVQLIIELLEYIRQNYGDSVWHALPHQVADFTATHKPSLHHQSKRICMLAYSHYEGDARVRRYAESLAERGDHVDVLALKRSPNDPVKSKVGSVNLYNLVPRVDKTERTPLAFLGPVLRFLLLSTVWIAKRHARQPYDVLHIHNMPDFLVFAAAYPKLTGAKVILDIHDLVPEFYANKFSEPNSSFTVSLLKYVERVCAKMADRVIISNHLWLEKYATRTGANGKCSVFVNNVDTKIFKPHKRTRTDAKLIILFPGGLQWHQGLDIALRAFKEVVQVLPNAEFHIYGDGIMKPTLVTLARDLGLNGSVRFFPPVRVTEIAKIMANADLGVVPKRADSFGNEAYSTKIMEFMSQGVPAVISRTAIDSYYFDETQVRFCESGNSQAFAEGIVEVLTNATLRQRLVQGAHQYVSRNHWGYMKDAYLGLVDGLISPAHAIPPESTNSQKILEASSHNFIKRTRNFVS
jgi:glycosyltransferase involved in cell wall biosynthesis